MSSTNLKTPPFFAFLLACWLPAGLAAAADGSGQPAWIGLHGEVADAPFSGPTDAVFAPGEVWAVGPAERAGGDGFALARWTRDESTGRLRFDRAFTREELGLGDLGRIHSLALSADGLFLYLGARTFAFESRILVFAREPAGAGLELVQTLGGLPASGNEGKLLITPDGRHLYYGSRGIVTCERDPVTGRLTGKAISSTAAVIDLYFDAERDQLYSIGEEVLHVWRRDPASGALSSIGVFDELDLHAQDGSLVRASSGRRLLRSLDGSYLYALAFGPSLAADPWSLVVFEMGGVPLLSGWGQGGPTAETFPSAVALDPGSGTLVMALAAPPGGVAVLAAYPVEGGGRRFGPEAARVTFPGRPDQETATYTLRFVNPGELYAGSWDGAHWQRFLLTAGQLAPASTFDGVQRLAQPVDLVLTPDRRTLLVAVPAAGAVARLSYLEGELGFAGAHRLAASRLLLLSGRYGVLLEESGSALRLFRLQGSEMVALGAVSVGHATEIAASPDGRLVYAFGTEGTVFRFDPVSERLLPHAEVPIGGSHPPRISPDGRFLLINQKYASTFPFFLSDWLEYDPVNATYRSFDELGSVQDELIDLAFSPAGDYLYVYKGSIDPRIVVFPRDPASGAIGEPIQEERSVPRATGGFYFTGQLELDRDGRFLYNLRQDDEKLVVYERNPYDGRLRLLETFATEDGSAAQLGGLDSGGRLRFAISSTGNELFLASEARGKVSLLRHHCRADDERSLCLGGAGRFRAEMSVFLPREAERAARRIAGPDGESGLFEFFSADNWESLVKVLDGCAQNDHFWVYAATASDLATRLRVTDTATGDRNSWSQAAGPARPAITDSRALRVCAAGDRPADPEAGSSGAAEAAESQELLLGNGRFSAKVHWRTAFGLEGEGEVVPFGSADSGLFSFFHPDNWELLVKVLDGCALNGHFWVYGAATTDLELRLEVTDLTARKTRTYLNPLGQPARAITDAAAFECRQ